MSDQSTVFVVEDDDGVRESTVLFLAHKGWPVQAFACAEEFLDAVSEQAVGCLLLDIRMPGLSGLDLQKALIEKQIDLPIIFLTGHGDVQQSVTALKRGAFDFLEKPYDQQQLEQCIVDAVAQHVSLRSKSKAQSEFASNVKSLTPREREVMDLMAEGLSSKLIAKRLAISPRTVEIHRAKIMTKMQVDSVAELASAVVKADLT